ncbi:ethylbenzene dehydrogenase-related protein [Salinigranum sp. GCM10025319]|uniref:ethylbenzene dehydrogenase-related protein n=1 Tax=Salinigranum sp. GCM10025319 TaxID=3252687 RepID=UPI00360E8F7B
MGSGRDRGPPTGIVVVTALVVLAAASPALVASRPANEIPIEDVSGGASPAEPTAERWDTVPAVTVPLSSAPSGLPNAESVSVERLTVQAARTDGHLYLRLSWTDPTADRNSTTPRAFADAVAVQLPVNTSVRPAIAMGSTRNRVNVWYWSADTGTEELLAGGVGTTTEFAETTVRTRTSHDDGRWTVVLARELRPDGANRTTIRGEHDVDVAFAVWNGSNMERSGHKSVSEWYHLPFGPGPQGPPYETILWTLAGLAIVGVALVTISAVRNTGEQGDR